MTSSSPGAHHLIFRHRTFLQLRGANLTRRNSNRGALRGHCTLISTCRHAAKPQHSTSSSHPEAHPNKAALAYYRHTCKAGCDFNGNEHHRKQFNLCPTALHHFNPAGYSMGGRRSHTDANTTAAVPDHICNGSGNFGLATGTLTTSTFSSSSSSSAIGFISKVSRACLARKRFACINRAAGEPRRHATVAAAEERARGDPSPRQRLRTARRFLNQAA